MARIAKAPSFVDIRKEMADALRRTSVNPSIAGYRPLPHQDAFHKSEKTGRLFLGGNRAGKTVSGAAEMVMRMTGKHLYNEQFKPPVRCRAIGVDFDNGVNRIMKPEIARWIPPSFLQDGSWEQSYERSSRTLTLTNGSSLEFMSYDQDVDKFAGTSRHFIWFDEEPPENIFNENLLRLADVNGYWWMTMTPLIDMSWTLDRLYDKGVNGDNPNLDVFRAITSDNSYVSSAVMDIMTEGMSDEEKKARQEGIYFSYSGAIYNDVLPGSIISGETVREHWGTYLSSWGHFAMLDHGFTNPTAFLIGMFDREGRIVIHTEYYKSKRTVKENAAAIKELLRELQLTNRLEYIVADPSIKNTDPITGTSIQMEYADNGLYLALANNDVTAGINRVYSRLKTGMLKITDNCEKTIWEHQRYRWAKFASAKLDLKNNQKETPIKKNDHTCDALRYGVVSRPSLPDEVDLKNGNMLNMPNAISDANPLIDAELVRLSQPEQRSWDPHMGEDW